jgi:tricorn protease
VIGDFPWTRPHWSKIEKYIESSAISPNGKRIAVAGRGDILLFLLKKEMQEIFLIVRASRIELWLGLRMVKASVGLMKAENINWLFQINLEEQKNKIAIENPTFYYKPSWSPDSKYLSFIMRTLWIVE